MLNLRGNIDGGELRKDPNVLVEQLAEAAADVVNDTLVVDAKYGFDSLADATLQFVVAVVAASVVVVAAADVFEHWDGIEQTIVGWQMTEFSNLVLESKAEDLNGKFVHQCYSHFLISKMGSRNCQQLGDVEGPNLFRVLLTVTIFLPRSENEFPETARL